MDFIKKYSDDAILCIKKNILKKWLEIEEESLMDEFYEDLYDSIVEEIERRKIDEIRRKVF